MGHFCQEKFPQSPADSGRSERRYRADGVLATEGTDGTTAAKAEHYVCKAQGDLLLYTCFPIKNVISGLKGSCRKSTQRVRSAFTSSSVP